MVSWGNSGYLLIVVIISLISTIFKFLIKRNKIKPNKVSRIFYEDEDDESFIKYWKKTKEKGMLRYTIKTTTIIMGIIAILVIFPILVKFGMNEFNQQMLFEFFIKGGIFGLLISLVLWSANSFRYRELED
jgi:hypothetical protein